MASIPSISIKGSGRTASQRKVMERARLAGLERDLQERLTAVSHLLKSAGLNPGNQSSGRWLCARPFGPLLTKSAHAAYNEALICAVLLADTGSEDDDVQSSIESSPSRKRSARGSDLVLRNAGKVYRDLQRRYEQLQHQISGAKGRTHASGFTIAAASSLELSKAHEVQGSSPVSRMWSSPYDHAFLEADIARVLVPFNVADGAFIDCNQLYSQLLNVQRDVLLSGRKISEIFTAVNYQRIVKIAPLLQRVDALFVTNIPAYRGRMLVDGLIWVEYEEILLPDAAAGGTGVRRVPKFIQMIHTNARPLPDKIPPTGVTPYMLPSDCVKDPAQAANRVQAAREVSQLLAAAAAAAQSANTTAGVCQTAPPSMQPTSQPLTLDVEAISAKRARWSTHDPASTELPSPMSLSSVASSPTPLSSVRSSSGDSSDREVLLSRIHSAMNALVESECSAMQAEASGPVDMLFDLSLPVCDGAAKSYLVDGSVSIRDGLSQPLLRQHGR